MGHITSPQKPTKMQRPQFYRHQHHTLQHDPNFRPRGRFQGHYRPRYPTHQEQSHSNEEHWCETCDRAFPTVAKLEEHKQQHQKCNIDGCQFTAHPNMVTKHIQMQHATGLYKKIGNLNNPEEINKWREERKKKYPTKQNIDKKAAQTKEKIARGEKMDLKQERFPHNRNNEQNGRQGWRRNYPFDRENQDGQRRFNKNSTGNTPAKKPRRKFPIKKPDTDLSASEKRGTLKPFTGIQQTVNVEDESDDMKRFNDLIEDDLDDDVAFETKGMSEKTICGALSTLICNYGSSDDEIDSPGDKANLPERKVTPAGTQDNIKRDNGTTNQNFTNEPIKLDEGDIGDDSGPEEVKVVKTSNIDDNKPSELNCSTKSEKSNKATSGRNPRNKVENPNRKQFQHSQRLPKIPSTLIYKLLKNEIKQERNIVLQCVRHIVKNNYFDKKK